MENTEDTWEFYLTWFNKESDNIIGYIRLPGVGTDDVCQAFKLARDEYSGDCLGVGLEQIEWLKDVAKGVDFRLDDFDYFIEGRQDNSFPSAVYWNEVRWALQKRHSLNAHAASKAVLAYLVEIGHRKIGDAIYHSSVEETAQGIIDGEYGKTETEYDT